MKLREVFAFEVGYHVRQPATWFYVALLLVVTVLLTLGGDPPVSSHFNSPVKIATFTLFLGLLGTLVTAGLFVDAGHRDLRWRLEPLFYTAPVSAGAYLGGRFSGALLLNALVLLVVPAGLLIGLGLRDLSPDVLGPFRAEAYLLPYLVFLLPTLLLNAAVLFGITVLSRRSLPGYLGAIGLVAAYLLTVNLSVGESSPLLALVEPTGAVALTAVTEGWTRAEQNTRLIGLQGLLFWNRLLWAVIAAGVLGFTWRRFRLAHAEPGSGRRRTPEPDAAPAGPAGAAKRAAPITVPSAPRSFGAAARVRQTLTLTRLELRQIVLGREFLLVVAGLALFVLLFGLDRKDPMFGTDIWPLTRIVAAGVAGRVVGILVALLTVFYAGELVWRERDAGIAPIGDSAPVADWVPLVGKLLALTAILALLQSVLMAMGILTQALQGYFAFEPGLYVRMLFGLVLPDYLLLAVLALVVHVLVDQKQIGHVVAMLLYLATLQPGRVGIEHNLLVYGSDPGWMYSDLSGFGPFLEGFVWFKLHWAAWALALALVACLFLVRGSGGGPAARLRLARRRFTPGVAAWAAAAGLLVLGTGGFVFYNTNVLNEYRTSADAGAVEAAYERRYKGFEHVPQPWLTGMRLHIELDPERGEVAVGGTYRLVNRTQEPIDSVHLSSFPYPDVALEQVRFERRPAAAGAGGAGAAPALEDPRHGYRIYALERALQPGDSLEMHFRAELDRRGFGNSGFGALNTGVVANGTHLELRRLLPAIGYQRDLLELSDPVARRRHGLGPRSTFRSIDDPRALRIPRSSPEADWIDFEATVGTAADQIAVLPGALQRSWVEDGRRYFHYRSERPIMNSIALVSAEYAVHEARWKDVEIRVFHHPEHAFNVGRMVRSIRASLEYYSAEFGPYPYRQLRMLEIPGYGNFGRAYPGQLVYTESNPIALARLDEHDDADAGFLVIAHEVAHQWWGHQVMGADVEGSQVLAETLAQYSALMVLERTHGPVTARRFLRSLHAAYLEGRGSHETPEVPLLTTTDHDYIHYRKGAVVMYALQDYIGEDRLNTALRRLARDHRFRGPPYATSLDLYRQLEAVTPDSLRYLLEDLFATVTLWDLRAAAARAEPTGGGEYRVTLEVEAEKMRSDSVGNDTRVPMNDLVDIAVFAADGERLYLRKHRIGSGRQTITVTVPGRPARAGIDPYHKLITRHLDGLIDGKVTDVVLEEHPAR